MQRRNVAGSSSAGSSRPQARSPPLMAPIPHHPARSPPIASFDETPPPSQASDVTPSPRKAPGSRVVTGGPADYQRFTSPPPNAQAAEAMAFGGAPPANGFLANGAAQQPGFGGAPQRPYGYTNGAPANQQWASAAPAWANDATAQMGMQFGKSAVAAGQDYVERNFVRHLPVQHLQHSYNVSNSYVVTKLALILAPWKHKPWSRLVKRSEATGQPEGYQAPRFDVNSPDLYIPTMALVTYILLSGVVAGSQGRFHPELLGLTASKSLGVVLLEFLVIKLGTYLLDIRGEGTVVDLVAYSGYKFVGIIVVLLGGLLGLKGWLSLVLFVYVFAANGFFLLRSLRYVVLPDPALQAQAGQAGSQFIHDMAPGAGQHVSHAQRSRRIRFLFGIAASQLVTMWLLCRV